MSQLTETVQNKLHEEIEAIEQTRDELRVQAHLMKEDIKARFADLEKRWETFRANPAHRLSTTAHETVKDMKLAYWEIKGDIAKLGRRGKAESRKGPPA